MSTIVLADVETALAQYNANLNWHQSAGAAELALEAVRWLIANQPESYSIGGKTITKNLPQLESERRNLEKFLGATAPRAFGRARVNRVDFAQQTGPE